MDPNPKTFPVLSFIMARIPYLGSNPPDPDRYDVEQPPPSDPTSSPPHPSILAQMPHLSDPEVVTAMARAVHEVSQVRSVLQTIGPKPDHETVDKARLRLAEVESYLVKNLEGLVLSPRPDGTETLEWRDLLAEKEIQLREAAEKEKSLCKTVLQLHEMHMSYEKMLKEAEERLVAVYEMARKGKAEAAAAEEEDDSAGVKEEVNEEVVGILSEGPGAALESVDLSNKQLKFLPEAFGKIHALKVLNLTNNQLEGIPDSVGGLVNLEELYLGTNLLVLLPDSIGLLLKLKILNVSANKLECLPDTICNCSSLVDLDASFNHLTYLPTNIGIELVNLQRLSIQLNKISHLPTSIGEMRSLQFLDAHFNELQGLPHSIGRLTNLEILNLSNNFSDMTALPETFGDLTNLKELDLSNNQIHALPDTFGRLENLTKLNLEQNPLVIPPEEIVYKGVEAVKTFMSKRWLELLEEVERKSMLQEQEETETGWLTRSTSWLKTAASTVTESVSTIMSPKAVGDPILNQQL